jgi:glutathione S-transferase
VQLREVHLRDKPAAMLQASPKGTVPVLVSGETTVLDESLDIMRWALAQHDPGQWLKADSAAARELLEGNDGEFKVWLDRYKYADRYPDHPASWYRDRGTAFLERLEVLLGRSPYLLADTPTLADMAILPFVRQFAAVDPAWFAGCALCATRAWLAAFLDSPLFKAVMVKYPPWMEGQTPVLFPPR